MAADNEMREYFDKIGASVAAGYNAAMRDGSIPAIGREMIKDVRNTLNEVFFGHGERGSEPGTPLTPLFHDIVEARKSHNATDGQATPVPSPGELSQAKSTASVHGEPAPDVKQQPPSPGDLAEGNGISPQQQSHVQQQSQRHGMAL